MLKDIQKYDSAFDLLKSFNIFYYPNDRFPYTNRLLWVLGNKPNFISGGNSLKRLYKLSRGTRSHALASIGFLATVNLFLGEKEQIPIFIISIS